MATNNEFIADALRMIGVLAEGETASADQGSDGLRAMNDMMAALLADDVDVGYAPQSDPTADNGINIEAREPLKYLLAARLSADYERPITPLIGVLASEGRARLLRDAVVRNLQSGAQTLPRGDSQGYWWDITTGP